MAWQEHRIDHLPNTILNEIARLLKFPTRKNYLEKLGVVVGLSGRGTANQRAYLSGDSGKLTNDAFLIVWHPQGKTIGSWVAIHRDNDTKELQLWPKRALNRSNYRLSASEKTKVDRHGRINKKQHMQNFVDRNSMLPFPELQTLPIVIRSTSLVAKGAKIPGSFLPWRSLLDPEIVGYPIVSEENYIINYNTIMSRSFLNRS